MLAEEPPLRSVSKSQQEPIVNSEQESPEEGGEQKFLSEVSEAYEGPPQCRWVNASVSSVGGMIPPEL